MAESRLDAYRNEIGLLVGQGVSQAEIARLLQQRYHVEVKRSTLSDYVKTLPEGEYRAGLNGEGPEAARAAPALADTDATAALMQAAGAEIVTRLGDLIEGVAQLKREGEDTARLVRESLDRHNRAFDALYATFRGAVLARIWLRAFLLTGCLWGGGIAALYVYRGGLPAWAAWASRLW